MLDETSGKIELTPRFTFAYLLLFVMAFGIVWELIEFSTSLLVSLFGGENVLTQYGLDDTMEDLVFDTLGGFVIAFGGTAVLSGLVDQLTDRVRTRTIDR